MLLFKKLILWLFTVFKNLFIIDLYYIEGLENHSGIKMIVCYAGEKENKNYFCSIVFTTVYNEIYKGKVNGLKLCNILKQNPFNCFLFFIEGNFFHRLFYQQKSDFFIPLWVHGNLKIPLSLSNKSAKDDVRKIKKNKLYYKVVRSENEVQKFYSDMYLPYVTRRFGRATCFKRYCDIVSAFKTNQAELLFVMEGDKEVAGQVIYFDRDLPRLGSVGVKNGDSSYVRNGAMAATYYFPAVYLQKLGYKDMALGGSRAFLNDGVLQNKRKWGLKLEQIKWISGKMRLVFKPGVIVKTMRVCDAVKGFFWGNPFLYIEKRKLNAALFLKDSNCQKGELSYYGKRSLCLPGVNNFMAWTFSEYNHKVIKLWIF